MKNTLTKRAAEEAGVPDLVELLDGPTAIAFVGDGDMVAVAKALSDSAKQTKILALKGGILEGKPMTAERSSGSRRSRPGMCSAAKCSGRSSPR